MRKTHWIAMLAGVALRAQSTEMPEPAAMKVNFAERVQPVLAARRFGCHGSEQQLGGFGWIGGSWRRAGATTAKSSSLQIV